MKDLSELAGLPLCLDGDRLVFGESLGNLSYARKRQVSTLSEVWMDPTVSGEGYVYSTYLDIFMPEERGIFGRGKLDHGYVLMPSGIYGREYPKLYGHYHSPAPGTRLAYPELHCVLHGTGHFLLQEATPPYEHILTVILIEARAGDRFIIPPNFGHITINPGDEPLVFEGFFAQDSMPDYEPYRRHRGGAYYEILGADKKPQWIPNENYSDLPPLRFVEVRDVLKTKILQFGHSCYKTVIRRPEQFQFLCDPQKYRDEWRF